MIRGIALVLFAGVAFASVEPAMEPLPPGQIEPGGWLRDWCVAAKDGYTGHMDDVDDEFKIAWTEGYAESHKDIYQWYRGAWSLEGGGYWLDGLVRLAYCLHDEALISQVKTRLGSVVSNASTNGCFFLWWLKDTPEMRANFRNNDCWVIWASGLISRALAGWYEATHDPKILEAMRTVFAAHPDFMLDANPTPNSALAAYQVWRWTKDPGVAKGLDSLADESRALWRKDLDEYRKPPDLTPGSTYLNQHGVEFVESTTPWAIMYLYTGRKQYLDAALDWHERLRLISMQPNGAPAMFEFYQPTGGACGTETCDVANYLWSQIVLFGITGDGKFADRAERCFFNAGANTVTRDFKAHVYQQPPNRLSEIGGQWKYQQKHSPLCCTAALNRIVPWYVTSMWMATPDGGYAALGYGPATLRTDKIEVSCATDYPFGETLTFAVTPKTGVAVPLHFRVPAWCKGATLTLNGSAVPFDVNRVWKAGDSLTLTFPMEPVLEKGYDRGSYLSDPHWNRREPRIIPLPNDDSGAPYAAVSCGPLLFTLGIPEKNGDPNTMADGAKWQYALDIDKPELKLTRTAMPQKWDWPLDAPVRIEASAVAIPEWKPNMSHPQNPALMLFKPASVVRERISLVPYGCAKLRLSMFPVATAVQSVITVEKQPINGVYDAGKAMKARLNGGMWSYGSAKECGGELTLLKDTITMADLAVQGFGIEATPQIAVNVTKSAVYVPVAMAEGQWLAPSEIFIHPADVDPKYAVVRFTVPKAGTYSVQATFRDVNSNPTAQTVGEGLGAEVAVAVNGTTKVKGIVSIDAGAEGVDGVSASHTFDLTPMSLEAGATIDFIVGPDGQYGWDGTALKARVTCAD